MGHCLAQTEECNTVAGVKGVKGSMGKRGGNAGSPGTVSLYVLFASFKDRYLGQLSQGNRVLIVFQVPTNVKESHNGNCLLHVRLPEISQWVRKRFSICLFHACKN